MSSRDDDVKQFAAVVFENVRQRYGLDHRRIIPCLTIAMGMAEADFLHTNPEITAEELTEERNHRIAGIRKIGLEILRETGA